ncbi:transcriptional regulator, LacI family [Xanthomonas oryzae pv. oryzae PXO99A]|uniref:Transcriptional regulator, LacI family n=1 Tax=Xanthomonas oryzae pv. oryzae (strain PXO99A) TaxID=360094 RepID=A0A0K0GMI8_XANOP|nr:transcriptional regulator, LacI family [Xanthomonas oryzae pv. oryzae PXO99A]
MAIKGKATSLDIAYLAGVSQPKVSRALAAPQWSTRKPASASCASRTS